MTTAAADLVEVWSGIQGEGIHVGRRHLFVRFAGCNLTCAYCDTPGSRKPAATAPVGDEKLPNPVSAGDLAAVIGRLDVGRAHDAISLTGGEPLLAADFIADLVPRCNGRRFYLETNGTRPLELEKVIGLVHTVAADIKLASSAGQPTDAAVARNFLTVAATREVFVKVVVCAETGESEIVDAAELVASVRAEIPFVIQPVTPSGGVRPPDTERLLAWQAAARRVLRDVRIIPQVHTLMGWR